MYLNTVFCGTGSCIPDVEVPNNAFLSHTFYTKDGKREIKKTAGIIEKFHERTGIKARRYARDDQDAVDLGDIALRHALISSGCNIDDLDFVIGATNFGVVMPPAYATDFVPSLATRLLERRGSKSNYLFAYDVIGGCPGWVEALHQGHLLIQRGATRGAIVAMETLSRVSDPHDKDSMIYADGAGAVIIEGVKGERPEGVLAYQNRTITHFKAKQSDVEQCAHYLTMGRSNIIGSGDAHDPALDHRLFLKMIGPNVHQLAIAYVPEVMRNVAENAGVSLSDINLFLLHQANTDLDYQLAIASGVPEDQLDIKVPMTIDYLGNSSVATIPTMLDAIVRGLLGRNGNTYALAPGADIMLASIGASMNINGLLYRNPLKLQPHAQRMGSQQKPLMML